MKGLSGVTANGNLPVATYASTASTGLADTVICGIGSRGTCHSSDEEGIEKSAAKHDGDSGAIAPVPRDAICTADTRKKVTN